MDYTDEQFGLPTVTDIIRELDKPGRDPRPEFKTATFADGVDKISDLEEGMILEGVVSNVANFGAFVDIGVHQDGLVHISALTDKFVSDPREVVKAGDIVKVKVMEVDVQRKRIGLSMRLKDEPGQDNRRLVSHLQKKIDVLSTGIKANQVLVALWRLRLPMRGTRSVVSATYRAIERKDASEYIHVDLMLASCQQHFTYQSALYI